MQHKAPATQVEGELCEVELAPSSLAEQQIPDHVSSSVSLVTEKSLLVLQRVPMIPAQWSRLWLYEHTPNLHCDLHGKELSFPHFLRSSCSQYIYSYRSTGCWPENIHSIFSNNPISCNGILYCASLQLDVHQYRPAKHI